MKERLSNKSKEEDLEVLISEKTMNELISWTIEVFTVGMLVGASIMFNVWVVLLK